MAFGRKVNDAVDPAFVEKPLDEARVADVAPNGNDVRHPPLRLERLRMSRVGHEVEVDEADLGMTPGEAFDEVGADEAGAARHENGLIHERIFKR